MRIRGQIGPWPVDLTLDLAPQEWEQVRQVLQPPGAQAERAEQAIAVQGQAQDALWDSALALLQEAGSIEGPQLLAQLAALAGSEVAGKRLLVRLRHCPQVKLQAAADAPLYQWIG